MTSSHTIQLDDVLPVPPHKRSRDHGWWGLVLIALVVAVLAATAVLAAVSATDVERSPAAPIPSALPDRGIDDDLSLGWLYRHRAELQEPQAPGTTNEHNITLSW
jgi:hypothetical protein